jgi:FKBP-type peptidyl-prolyl cis-trans isomerase
MEQTGSKGAPMTLKMTLKWAMVLLGIVLLVPPQVFAGEPVVLKTQKDHVSYSIGVSVIRNFKHQGLEIDLDVVMQGMKDALGDRKLLLTDEELRSTLTSVQTDIRLKQRQARRFADVDRKKEGDAFLAENKKNEGVVTLPSGLQYKILKAGDGRKPTDADIVECRYHGTLINGVEFDSTPGAGQPRNFKVRDAVVPGMTEALKLMPVGSTWRLFIPSELSYQRGSGSAIGPNETLIFEIELLSIM